MAPHKWRNSSDTTTLDNSVMTPRTVVTITHIDAAGITVQHEAVREGEFVVTEQCTSYMREVALEFFKKLQKAKD